ncbi:hypothetical protein [Sporosarcina pasteurii]|uniref:Lipoprotein n=1 Tax=Sporosarcina pasteurii TaxID=1474 RepID=A0A380BCN4_SPOPA|nr:hypothetical protein [Sporosarcina pasteurii]MDS9472257.1 hypothetical protein [Sporosarcina pasteurii]QBQ06239.1 hypothetical protein E2C16_11440 [Sporosarcina pasteurii]SUI99123.1 Uncharacterised protein [Sporosarcina pasteurii]
MLKKAFPFILMSTLALGACMNNGALPENNETPMEDNLDNREQNWTPDVQDERRGGSDLDGIDNNNGNNGGVINDDGMNDGNMFGDDNAPLLDENLDGNNNNNR